jgi:PAS domain S-box-containing protein
MIERPASYGGDAMEKGTVPERVQRFWLPLVIMSVVAVSAAGYLYYSRETNRIRQQEYDELAAIAKLKVGQITQWRQERLADISRSTKDLFFKRRLQEWLRERSNAQLQAELQDRLVLKKREQHYADVLLLDMEGRVLLSAESHPHPLCPDARMALEQALAGRAPMLSDLYRCPKGMVHVDAVGPIMGDDGQPVASLVLRSNAESVLYPLIQMWPAPSKTAETLLVRRDGDDVLFLNDVRHRPHSALSLREPITSISFPAVQAVLGREGMFQGKDYRGAEVLADLRQVPESPWFMVAKVDAGEILAEARYRGGVVLLFAALFILLAVSVIGYGYRYRQERLYRDLYRSERERRAAQEEFRTTLYSIGDAVITTDKSGLVKQMNLMAERLTGWLETEARGKSVSEIFHIVNEDSREAAENPVQRVVREGTVVGLANHTLLIARDGSESPIADSGAPIRDENGHIIGVVLVFRDQTEERRASKALRASEEHHRLLIENLHAGVVVHAPDTSIQLCNRVAARLLDLPYDEMTGKFGSNAAWKFLHEDGSPMPVDEFPVNRVLSTGEPLANLVVGIDRPGIGDRVWVLVNAFPEVNEKTESQQVVVTFVDISDRKQAEAALAESEKRFRLLYEEAPVPYQSLDEDGYLLEINAAWLELLGYTRDEVIGKSFADFLTPRSQERFRETFPAFKRAGQVYGVEHEMVCKDKTTIDVAIDGRISMAEGSKSRRTHCVFQDITERKRTERALQESEQRYRAVFNNASAGICLTDQQGRFLETNNTFRQFLGYTSEELQRLTVLDIVHPEDVDRSRELHKALVGGQVDGYRLEKRHLRKDGTILWSDIAVSAIRDADGQYRGTVRVVRDITAQKISEEARIRLAAAVEQAVDGIAITDTQGTIQYVNPAYEKITECPRDEAIGQKPTFLRSEEEGSSSQRDIIEALSRGERWSGRLVRKRKDGGTCEEDVTVTPVLDSLGNIGNFVVIKRDMTKEANLQRQLFQAQKMEAVGTLAGGIAHDFNNMLQVALGYTELALGDESMPEHCRSDLRKVYDSAKRGADLVQRLLTLSRKAEIRPQPLNLNRRITELRNMLERTIPKMIEIRLALDDGLATMNADPTQIDQILMNLAVNARDAMPEGGKLVIETDNVTLGEDYSETHLGARPGPYVLLSVSDTGEGMDKETVQHIFEPFFTTKGPGEGTGLGLATVYGIVKQHDGHITCYSELGSGTTFKLYFPALVSVDQSIESEPKTLPRGGSETILLVDDEEFLRDLGCRILTKAGYTVITASNGKEALDEYRERCHDIDLVILDVIMPEMGGKQCLEALLSINPSARVVVASGFSVKGPTRDAVTARAKGFVNKPYDIGQLLAVVREVLDKE